LHRENLDKALAECGINPGSVSADECVLSTPTSTRPC
jgi:hypothetical protein